MIFQRKVPPLDQRLANQLKPWLEPVPGAEGWREYIVHGGRRALIQRGDVLLVTGQRVERIAEVFGSLVTYFTRSIYYHAMIYDHDWVFWHAFQDYVYRDDVESFFFNQADVALSWLRPRRRDGAPLTELDTARVVNFCRRQEGKKYDLWANLSFLFRADGMMWFPARLRPILWRLFQDRNLLRNSQRWHCSELAAAAWMLGAEVEFVDEMRQKVFVSPADIYDSIYTELVCTLKITAGAFQLLTAESPSPGRARRGGRR